MTVELGFNIYYAVFFDSDSGQHVWQEFNPKDVRFVDIAEYAKRLKPNYKFIGFFVSQDSANKFCSFANYERPSANNLSSDSALLAEGPNS